MNATARIMQEAPHRHCDVRPTSTGGDWPYGVIIHLDASGRLMFRGFHPGRGRATPTAFYDRQNAINSIRSIVETDDLAANLHEFLV